MKVALVHDYLVQAGGAERALGALHRLFPDAPIYTTIADPAIVASLGLAAEIRTSWMQRLPAPRRTYRAWFMLYPHAVESLDLSGFDLVVSSTSAYAKGALAPAGARHLCYCHTPMRFVWRFDAYAARERWGPIARRALPPFIERLRRWDRRAAERPTAYAANSSAVRDRIRQCYGRDSVVVFAPVEVERFRPSSGPGEFHLVVSRLVPYKRVDLAIRAFNRLGRPLLVVGDGPARRDLERLAGPTVRLVGRCSDREVADYYARCRALIFPGEEDFGLTPLEANAAGRPVVAYRAGGALDTVIDGETGVFFTEQSVNALCQAVAAADRTRWRPDRIREHALGFREEVFRERFWAAVQRTLAAPPQGVISTRSGASESATPIEATPGRSAIGESEVSGA